MSATRLADLISLHYASALRTESEFHWLICILLARFGEGEGDEADIDKLAREVADGVPRMDGRVRYRYGR